MTTTLTRSSLYIIIIACMLLGKINFAHGQNNSVSGLFETYRNLGFEFEDRNKLDSALTYYLKALRVAEISQNSYDLTTIYTDLAIACRKSSDYISAKNYHIKALDLARKSGDDEMVEGSLHGLGSLYEQTGDYEKAVNYYLDALKRTQARGDKSGIIVTLQNISKTYMQLNYEEMSISHIDQAEHIADEVNNDSLMANVLHDYGEILLHFKHHEKALEKLNHALKTYEQLGYRRYIASALVYIGDVYSKIGRPESTLEYFQKALGFRDAMDTYVYADLLFKKGELHLSMQQPDLAEQDYQQSLSIASANEFKELQQKNSQKLFTLNQQKGNIDQALAFLNVSMNLKDSLYNIEKTQRIAELQLRFDNEKQQRLLQSLELKQNRLLLIGSCFIFALLISFLGYLAWLTARNNKVLQQKNREIELQNIQLTESNELLRQYAYVAAHDLKEPLRTICSFINLLEMKFGAKINDPQATEYMQLISNSAKRMNLLLTDLLEYSSIFHQSPGSDAVSPAKVVDEVMVNLKSLKESKLGEIYVQENFPMMYMNRIHLLQIFQNLIGNALKFTPDDRPASIHVQCKDEGKDVIFSIKDNGVGINDLHREKIFNLFFRAHSQTEFEGTGIGLSICKSLIEKYGGRIWFQSVESQGTTFFISFPKEITSWRDSSHKKIAAL